jgi:hypothetical protein
LVQVSRAATGILFLPVQFPYYWLPVTFVLCFGAHPAAPTVSENTANPPLPGEQVGWEKR